MDIVVKFMDTLATVKVGPKDNRYGVFGPYTDKEKPVIDYILKLVASQGRAAITGEGYYLPDDPVTFHKIEEIRPEEAWTFFEKLLPMYQYLLHLPRITKKSIFDMNEERAQAVELIGCHNYGVPALGFIIHPEISRGRDKTNPDCEYLVVNKTYAECVAPASTYCPYHKPARPFCPFYNSVDIPYTYKQLFLDSETNRLIAVRKLEDLEEPVIEFLKEE